jgi:hypothetical protein
VPSIENVLPYLRVATAVVPFVAALLVRLLVGGNRVTRFLLSAATTWFAVNILLSPFTDLARLPSWLW